MSLGKLKFILNEKNRFKPLSANPTKWSNTNRSSAKADELFEYVWQETQLNKFRKLKIFLTTVFGYVILQADTEILIIYNLSLKKLIHLQCNTLPANIYLLKINNRNSIKKVWNMFQVNNKNTRTTVFIVNLLTITVFIVNIFHTFFKRCYFWLWTSKC